MAHDPFEKLRGKPWFIELDQTPVDIMAKTDLHFVDYGGHIVPGQVVTIPAWRAKHLVGKGMAKYITENKAMLGPQEDK